MRKVLAAVGLAALVVFLSTGSLPASAQSGSCGDSWDPDGHSGPWYTAPMTLHGNTLHIGGSNCNADTPWNVTYWVFKENPSTGQAFSPIMVVRNGNGPTSWSVSTSPVGCNPGWLYYTQVKNDFTGNYIRKPNSGLVIC